MPQNTFSSAVTAGSPSGRLLRQVVLVLAGTLVLTASAYVSVPMWPVPITMQTLAVALVGAFYGWRLGGITIVAWLLEGLAGLPVFAGGTGGLMSFVGPTGGYLLAYPLMGALVGWLVARGWNGARPVLAFLGVALADAVCLAAGWAWLATLVGPEKAFLGGVAPFVLGDLLKAGLAAATLAIHHSARRRGAR